MASDRAKLFVGVSANGEDAESQAVLEYTVRENSSIPVDIEWMKQSKNSTSFWYSAWAETRAWDTSLWATPFSGFRWGIPAFCNFEGQAIYCDSDFWFPGDLAELWEQEFEPGKVMMGKGGEESWRTCCVKWNCEAAKDHVLPLDRLRYMADAHKRMINYYMNRRDVVQVFEGNWNCIDMEDYVDVRDPEIKAHHYSDMGSQVHGKYAAPRLAAAGQKHWFDGVVRPHWRADYQKEFDMLLTKAEEAGYTVQSYVPDDLFGEYRKESQEKMGSTITAHRWSR